MLKELSEGFCGGAADTGSEAEWYPIRHWAWGHSEHVSRKRKTKPILKKLKTEKLSKYLILYLCFSPLGNQDYARGYSATVTEITVLWQLLAFVRLEGGKSSFSPRHLDRVCCPTQTPARLPSAVSWKCVGGVTDSQVCFAALMSVLSLSYVNLTLFCESDCLWNKHTVLSVNFKTDTYQTVLWNVKSPTEPERRPTL